MNDCHLNVSPVTILILILILILALKASALTTRLSLVIPDNFEGSIVLYSQVQTAWKMAINIFKGDPLAIQFV